MPHLPREPRPHRPVPKADLSELMGGQEDVEPFARTELAQATAFAVITHGREGGASMLDLADRVGLDTLAELWREEDPSSLPGALWALYLLRRWCQSNGDELSRLWRAGRIYQPADEVVAGVADGGDPESIGRLADAVLGGAYGGDFAVALERAAAFFRIVGAGRRDLAADGVDGERERALADRNLDVAHALARAADRWRRNAL